jgi:predicted nucleotidyltransferase
MHPTDYPTVNDLIDELLSLIKSILDDNLVGLYLYGSLVTGDFDLDYSDIDLLAALSSDISDEEFTQLKQMHEQFAQKHPEWDNRIEVQYLSVEALKTFKYKESKVATISPGDEFQTKNIGKHWLMNWYVVQEHGKTLYGADQKTIIDSISKDEFIQSVKEHTQNWNEWIKPIKRRKAQAYAILTLCRALYSAKNGEQVSKVKAAEWTMKELPEWKELIQNALVWRRDEKEFGEDEVNHPKTVEFVNVVRNIILKH